jgi:gamma-tubulin complex component 3
MLAWKFIVVENGYFGWDVFSLDCKLEYPLVLVFPPSIMERYGLIFNFLWKLKRI